MDARTIVRAAPAALLVAASLTTASSSPARAGGGAHVGSVVRMGAGHSGPGGFRGPVGGGPRVGSCRALPPLSGVIHERVGMRPYLSAYGHTATAVPFAADRRRAGIFPFGAGGSGWQAGGYGHTATEPRPTGFARAGFGHVGTAVPRYALTHPGSGGRGGARFDRGLAFRERLRFDASRRGFAGGFGGGYGDGIGGYGGGGDVAAPGGTYGSGVDGAAGPYGGTATAAGAYGGDYASEAPLAARFAEPPLAPSPGAPYDPADRYAYAAAADVGPGPRVISVRPADRAGCGCGPRARSTPMIYRYGVGTAY